MNIRFTLVAVLIAATGQAFTFAVDNKRVDGTETLFGRKRDFDWKHTTNDPNIAALWGDFQRSKLRTRLVASAAPFGGVKDLAKKVIFEAFKAVPEWAGLDWALIPAWKFIVRL